MFPRLTLILSLLLLSFEPDFSTFILDLSTAISCTVYLLKFLRFYVRFPFNECGMAPNAAPTMIGIVSVFTFPTSWLYFYLFHLFICFFRCLVFFSTGTETSISLHHFSGWYPVRRLAQFCHYRFIDHTKPHINPLS